MPYFGLLSRKNSLWVNQVEQTQASSLIVKEILDEDLDLVCGGEAPQSNKSLYMTLVCFDSAVSIEWFQMIGMLYLAIRDYIDKKTQNLLCWLLIWETEVKIISYIKLN